jgi:hypothetical protein
MSVRQQLWTMLMTHREKSLTGHIVNDPNGTMSLLRAAFERMFEVHEDRDPPLGTEDNPIIIPQSLYDLAKAEGCIMRGYAVARKIPSHGEVMKSTRKMPTNEEHRAEIKRRFAAGEPLGASHVPEIKPGVFAIGSLNGYASYGPSSCPRTEKLKYVDAKQRSCPDDRCMPGHNGKCTACAGDN